ncbi:hypothetical protein BDV93DRAFT_529305 [Ceratobasidium sp. AG-I]|nr:hypothetical protein BDV93DRAFT_529305 [Ceratobasidium sp. AG-I]
MSQIGSGTAIQLPVVDCTCSYRCENGQDFYEDSCDDDTAKWRCNLPVCAVRAFKDLQTQQIAHASSISQLKSVIGQIQTPPRHPSLEVPEDSASHSSIGSKSVQEEVRRWLGRCRVEVECEDS